MTMAPSERKIAKSWNVQNWVSSRDFPYLLAAGKGPLTGLQAVRSRSRRRGASLNERTYRVGSNNAGGAAVKDITHLEHFQRSTSAVGASNYPNFHADPECATPS